MKKKPTTKTAKGSQTKQKALPRGKAFNLDIRTKEQGETLIAHLQLLKVAGGWMLMKQILEGNMAALERAIITKADPQTGTKLTEAQVDELRSKHAVFGEVVGKPDQLIELFRQQSGGFVPSYDPYHTDIKKMLRDDKEEAAEESAGVL
jgi:hypothetical protein